MSHGENPPRSANKNSEYRLDLVTSSSFLGHNLFHVCTQMDLSGTQNSWKGERFSQVTACNFSIAFHCISLQKTTTDKKQKGVCLSSALNSEKNSRRDPRGLLSLSPCPSAHLDPCLRFLFWQAFSHSLHNAPSFLYAPLQLYSSSKFALESSPNSGTS